MILDQRKLCPYVWREARVETPGICVFIHLQSLSKTFAVHAQGLHTSGLKALPECCELKEVSPLLRTLVIQLILPWVKDQA